MFTLVVLQATLAQLGQVPIVFSATDVAVGQRVTAAQLVQRTVPGFWAGRTYVEANDASLAVNGTLAEPLAEGDMLSWGVFVSAMSAEECTTWRPGVKKARTLPPAQPPDGGSMKYVIAARDVPQGKVLEADDLMESGMPPWVGTRSLVPASARALLIGERALVRFDTGDMLRPGALSGFASPDRCRLWKAEFGNVFDERGAPPETKKLECPTGAAAHSAKGSLLSPREFVLSPGWVFRCETKEGVSEGPRVTWSRRGTPFERASFRNGLREGVTVLTTEQSTLTLQFLNGVMMEGPEGTLEIAVAKKDLPAGTKLEPSMLMRSVGPDLLALWVVTREQMGLAMGKTLSVRVRAGAPIFFSDLK